MSLARRELGLCTFSLLACSVAAAIQPSFQSLGPLPGGGYTWSPMRISADGAIVVGAAGGGLPDQIYRWADATGIVSVGTLTLPPGYTYILLADVSADGEVAVGYVVDPGPEGLPPRGFRWTPGSGTSLLPNSYVALSVSGDGDVAVGLDESGAFRRWSLSGGHAVIPLPHGTDVAYSNYGVYVSFDGSTIAGNASRNVGDPPMADTCFAAAFVNTGGSSAHLGHLPGFPEYSIAHGVSVDGAVIIGSQVQLSGGPPDPCLPSASIPTVWSATDGLKPLAAVWPGLSSATASGVSAGVARVAGIGPGFVPVLWDATHGARNLHTVLSVELGLDLTGWTLQSVSLVSADGTAVIGLGSHEYAPGQFRSEVWRALVPFSPGDLNGDGATNGADVQPFVGAIMAGSTSPSDLDRADFNQDGVIDPGDVPGMVAALLAV